MKPPLNLIATALVLLWMGWLYGFEHDHTDKEVTPAKETYFLTEDEVIDALKAYLVSKKEKIPTGKSSINLNATRHRISDLKFRTMSFVEHGVELTLEEIKEE